MVNSWSRAFRHRTVGNTRRVGCLVLPLRLGGEGSPLENKTLRRPRVTSVLTNIARADSPFYFFRLVSFRFVEIARHRVGRDANRKGAS